MKVFFSRSVVILLAFICVMGCHQPSHSNHEHNDILQIPGGALLLTHYKSIDAFREKVSIEYAEELRGTAYALGSQQGVRLRHKVGNDDVITVLQPGVSEKDFQKAKAGGLMSKLRVCLKSPYALANKNDLARVEILGRRRHNMFGEGDVSFYDLAENMVFRIADEDILTMPAEDISEKGYLNTFNHITAQALMTTLYSEELADFVSDVHERNKMPELISGKFTPEQLDDLANGPVDNYLDMINNEWGQEIGKSLKKKYAIKRSTRWTPELLTDYLNDIQRFHSWVFKFGCKPFRPTDEVVVRFASKINRVNHHLDEIKKRAR
jgi:hypothetical protein